LSRCETTTMSLYSEDMRPREFLVSPCSWPPVIATTQSNCQTVRYSVNYDLRDYIQCESKKYRHSGFLKYLQI